MPLRYVTASVTQPKPPNTNTQITTIDASTTGFGTSAALDPTLLENGNYFLTRKLE